MTPRIACLTLVLALALHTAAFATARFSGEKGARPHLARLAAGQEHTCAILDDGTVECWGHNNFGQVGDGTQTTRLVPVTVTSLGGSAISIAAGSVHTCALLSNGSVRCWGFNGSGQLGNGSTALSNVPVTVTGLSGVVALAAGSLHTCALRTDGSVWCWGAALANGSNSRSLVPIRVNDPHLTITAQSITAGANHTGALFIGDVLCWGQNTYGQLGSVVDSSGFARTAFVDDPAVEVSAGSTFTCALSATGAMK